MIFRLRGICLPDETERDLTIADGVLREGVVGNADVLADGGWLVPGLVDVHTHPGTATAGDSFDPNLYEQQLAMHRDAGVLTIRCPGLAGRPPMANGSSVRVIAAGPWIAAPGAFFSGWGRQVPLEDLPDVVEEEARMSDGWVKVVADWLSRENGKRHYGPTIPPDVMSELVGRAHAAGARVAVHTQHGEGARAAVAAGADSIEHGMHLSEDLLDTMARDGIALVPTMNAFASIPAAVASANDPDSFMQFLLAGAQRHPSLVRAAWEAGVRVLAGTDGMPHGNVAAEVEHLVQAGLPAHVALGAASWDALRFLGLPGLEDGAPANVVIYDEDPRDPAVLRRPSRIISAGRVVG